MTLMSYCGKFETVVPLLHRVGNPPPKFLGRDAESIRLVELLRHAALAVVSGPVGVGKATLVRHVVHRKYKSRLDRALQLVVDRDACEHIETLLITTLREISKAVPLAAAQTHPTQTALDLGENLAGVIVLHVAEPSPHFWRFAETLAQFARATFWVIVTPGNVPATLLPHLVTVGPLPPTVLDQLWKTWLSDPTHVAHRAIAVAAAKGSPQRLWAICRALHCDPQLLQHEVVALLNHLHQPVPRSVIVALVAGAGPVLDQLVELGIVLQTHDQVIVLAEARTDGEPALATLMVENAIALLERTGDAALHDEAIALALEHDFDRLALELLVAGSAPAPGSRATRKIAKSSNPLFVPWRLRAANDLGDSTVLRRIAKPRDGHDLIMWAEGQARAGTIEQAIAEADAAIPHVSIEQADVARLLAARMLGTHGDIATALQRVDEISTPSLRLHCAVLRARCLLMSGKGEQALAAASEVGRELSRITEPVTLATAEIWLLLAAVHHDAAQLPECERIVARLRAATSADITPFFYRRVALLEAALLADRGRIIDCETMLTSVVDASAETSLHHPFGVLIRSQLALLRGDTAFVSTQVSALARDNPGWLGAWASCLLVRAALFDASIVPARRVSALAWDHCSDVHRARLQLRTAGTAEVSSTEVDGNELRLAVLALRWEASIITGHGDAVEIARAGLALAKRLGLSFAIAEAALGECEALSARGDFDGLQLAAAQLVTIAAQFESPSFGNDARLFLAIAGNRLQELEHLAVGRGPCARRAQYLLGDLQRADFLDRAVCAHRIPAKLTMPLPSEWRAGWGIDHAKCRAWRRDGVVVEFHTRPLLWRLLELLIAAQPDASKELLVEQVWGNVYHPLFHDKRLHNAIYKLRALLDDADADLSLIVTTETGYQINRGVPLRIYSAPVAAPTAQNGMSSLSVVPGR